MLVSPLSSCGGGETVCGSEEEYETPVTDSFKFTFGDNLTTSNFIDATQGLAIMEVKLAAHVDGDTTYFYPLGKETALNRFSCRYQGVNTPESTGHIQPWGIKASHFTKSKLKSAERIAVVNDLTQFEKYDSSGGRYLGFVWYLPEGKSDVSDFRLLNLEIVEQGYSNNQLHQDSDILVGYEAAFREAAANASSIRINGETDCDYDSSGDVVETTIANAKAEYDTLGVDDSTANSGKQLRITAQVLTLDGSNFYARDLEEDENGIKQGIYAFTSYKNTGAKIGDIVRFYAKITKYYGNMQLTDVQINNDNMPFEILATKDTAESLGYTSDYAPLTMNYDLLKSNADFSYYSGNMVKTEFLVSSSDNYVTTSTGSTTAYYLEGTVNNINIEIRFSGHTFFNSENVIKGVFSQGKKYSITALISFFQYNDEYDGSYQLEIPGFKASELKNYISEID